jgi:hypothetical protein
MTTFFTDYVLTPNATPADISNKNVNYSKVNLKTNGKIR